MWISLWYSSHYQSLPKKCLLQNLSAQGDSINSTELKVNQVAFELEFLNLDHLY